MNRTTWIYLRNYVYAMIAVMSIIIAARALASSVNRYATAENIMPISGPTSTPGGLLIVDDKIYDLDCGANGEVKSATIDLEISGGVPPYHVEFDPGDAVLDLNGSGVRFTMEGGKSLIVKVKSETFDGEPRVERDIYAPSYRPECEGPTRTPTLTVTPTASDTPTATHTPTATPTKTQKFGVSATNHNDGSVDSSVTPPPINPTLKSTIYPTIESTLEPTIQPTIRPTTQPTTQPTIQPTVRPTTQSTTEPTTQPTIRPTTQPTTGPTTQPTIHPTTQFTTEPPIQPTTKPASTQTSPPPSSAECEDGEDNDNDGRTDSEDPECKGHNDNHEDK